MIYISIWTFISTLYINNNTLLNIIFPITKLSFLLVDSGGYIVGGSLVFFWSGLVWAVWAVLFSLSSGCLVCWFVRRGFVLLCSGCWVWLCCCLSGVLFVWWVLSRFLLVVVVVLACCCLGWLLCSVVLCGGVLGLFLWFCPVLSILCNHCLRPHYQYCLPRIYT